MCIYSRTGFFFFKQKTAYELRISDWSSDVCSADLEQDRVRHAFELGHDLFQPLLEIAAVTGSGEQRAHVERIDDRGQQYLGHVALDDLAREALGDRGLADEIGRATRLNSSH